MEKAQLVEREDTDSQGMCGYCRNRFECVRLPAGCPSVYLSACLSVYLPVCVSVCLRTGTCVPACWSVCLPANLHMPVCLSVFLSVCPSIWMPDDAACLSVSRKQDASTSTYTDKLPDDESVVDEIGDRSNASIAGSSQHT